jgi:hypothetical protein
MNREEFLTAQYHALRSEIDQRQMRMFWTATLGLLGVPVLTYLAADTQRMVWLLMPYFVLVVLLLFIKEQNGMMRAGRYIREQIEGNIEHQPGWEAWLESRNEWRMMEKHFFACFILVFFLYYFLTIGMAIYRLAGIAGADPTGLYNYCLWGAVATYLLGGIWALSTLLHHWRSSVSTVQ